MPERSTGLYRWVLGTLLLSGAVTIIFDVAKKTVFLGASWNYDYPAFSFVFNVPALLALVALSAVAVVAIPRLLELDRRSFAVVLLALGGVLYALSFFALPEKSAFHALTPDKAMYCASLEAVNSGVLSYFREFHSIGHCTSVTGFEPADGRVASIRNGAETLSSWLAGAEWFPLHESWAEYAAGIGEQKHGPIPPLIAASGIVLFGQSPGSAVAINYAAAALLAPLAYLTFSRLFDDEVSRIGGLLIAFLPAIFIYVRKHTVAYDTYTAVFTFAATYLFVRAVGERSYGYAVGAGVLYSLAALSKATAVPVAAVFFVVALASEAPLVESLKRLGAVGASALVAPLVLFVAGYNTIIQYLFQVALQANVQTEKGGLLLAQKPQPALGHPVLNFAGATYKYRVIGIALVLFAFVFLLWAVRNRETIRRETKYHYGLAFLIPITPLVVMWYGLNLGRQLLPYYIGIGLLAVAGLELVVREVSHSRRILLYRVSVAITAAIALVNF